MAAVPPAARVAATREFNSARSSAGTGKACTIVQPPVAGQFVPRVLVPPAATETYSGNVAPVRQDDRRHAIDGADHVRLVQRGQVDRSRASVVRNVGRKAARSRRDLTPGFGFGGCKVDG